MASPPPPPDRSSREKKKKNKKKSSSSSSSRRKHHHDKAQQSSRESASSSTTSLDDEHHHQEGEGAGVTVAEFRQQQQHQQDKASNRKGNNRKNNHMQLTQGDNDSGDNSIITQQQQSKQQVVDTIPADHPSSSIIQTLRTCTLCHRTLPRAQFSERDRYTIHESLATGAICRTCSMTIAAVRLKGVPNTEQLLMAYAERGEMMASMIEQGGGVSGGNAVNRLPYNNVAGYLEGNNNSGEEMILRQNSDNGGNDTSVYKGAPVGSVNLSSGMSSNRTVGTMGMMPSTQTFTDVNSAFSGQQYGGGEEDRPANVADCKYIDALLRLPSYLNLNAYGIFQSCEDVSISMATLEAVRLYGTVDESFFIPHDTEGLPAKSRRSNPRSILPTELNNHIEDESSSPKSIVCLVLGEGRTPRTAILAAQHYGWTTYSIDPSLSEGWDGYHDDIRGFTGYSGSISDFVESTADSMIEIQNQSVKHLVIIGIQKQKDELRLKGKGNIMEIRSRYNDVPTTLVSVSPVRKATLAPKRRDGQHLSKLEKDIGYEPNCSYIDSGVFSECRLIEVYNFHNADESGSEYDSYDDDGYDDDEHNEQGVGNQEEEPSGDYRDWPTKEQGRTDSLRLLKRTKDGNEDMVYGQEDDHAIKGDEGVDNDIWGKALAKHNDQEQRRFVDQFEELERTKSEAVRHKEEEEAASSRPEQFQDEETHDDLIAWSDDKLNFGWSEDNISDLPKISRPPKKSQPWHKKDSASIDSFGSYD
jgi:hypothetical protein